MAMVMNLIRYLLITVGATTSLLLGDIASYGIFTSVVLLFILIGQVRIFWMPAHLRGVFIVIEIGSALWMSWEFGGAIVLLFYSILFSMFAQPISYRRTLIALQWIVILMTKGIMLLEDFIMLNTLYIVIAIVLDRMVSHSREKLEALQLYDELRRKHYELEDSRARLTEYAKRIEHITQLEERNRISRDIHDDLGHKLIRLKMMLEVIVRSLQPKRRRRQR